MFDFWKNKRVLVTGHTGFKGSWLSHWLKQLRADVCGVSLEPETTKNLYDQADIGSNMHSIIGDIRDKNLVNKVFTENNPEIVFHLAAQSLVRRSYTTPIETFETNVMGTINILEATRNCQSVRSLVIVTSDKCYENNEQFTAFKETAPMGGKDPYSASKACAEIVTNAYRSSFSADGGALIATARAGNVIGGGDWSEDRLIPDLITSFQNKSSLIIRNPKAIRPWQHVLEPLFGYMLLAEKLWFSHNSFAEGWNFGPEKEEVYTVQDVVERLKKIWGASTSWQQDPSHQPHEAQLLTLNSDKAMDLLGWKPKWSLDTTLEYIADSYKKFDSANQLRQSMDQQIEEYMKK